MTSTRTSIVVFLLLFAADARPQEALIVPGVRVGAITAETGEADLISVFGRDRFSAHKVGMGEGNVCDGALIRFDNEESLAVAWRDRTTKTGVSQVVVRSRSLQTKEGLRVGLSLAEVESLNGKPLIINGFGWDYGGVVNSWEGGRLAPIGLTHDGDVRVWFATTREQETQLSRNEYASVS
ncbi:MAG: hypothetical protein O3A53_14280 [Acidobacteria bacterium]|nr:hypothetical protein [Acidobacteriota bacterium]MDA1235955.1 hypothetical protein [Acidobacteriota bacterium]